MRVGIDYSLAATHGPGLGRYSRELVRSLCQTERPQTEFALWEWGSMRKILPPDSLGLAGKDLIRKSYPIPTRFQRGLAGIGFHPGRKLARRDPSGRRMGSRHSRPLDLFHRILPGRPHFPHDLPFSLPIVRLPDDREQAPKALLGDLGRASGVLVFSAEYARRLEAQWGVERERIHQVPVGCEHWWRDLSGPAPQKQPTILVLGAQKHSRRFAIVLEAFASYCAQGGTMDLLLVGTPPAAGSALEQQKQRSPVASRILSAPPVESQLPECVGACHALLHLAEDEGSAVTPLEAARMGLHLALEALPAFREVFDQPNQADSLWIRQDPSAEDVCEALLTLDGLAAATPHPCPGFSWADCASAHLQAWEKCLPQA